MRTTTLTLLMLMLAPLAACAGGQKKPVARAVTPAPAPAPKPQAAAAPKPAPAPIAETFPTTDPLYFAFDSALLKTENETELKAVAAYLVKHPEAHIRVEGNTDTLGTAEYNLALGERRARAAAEYLLRLGVKADQLKSVSYGEEHPAVRGDGEAVWAQNRRDVLVPGGS